MKKFMVAHIDRFDYDLQMCIVEAENELQAMYIAAKIYDVYIDPHFD